MKNSIKLSALLLLAGTGIFAAGATAKPIHPMALTKGVVTFSPVASKRGVEIKVKENTPAKALVIIYNYENDMIWKDVLSKKKGMDREFILNQLDNGNYTIEVTLNKQVVKKIAHVYYKGDSKLVALRG